MQISQKIKFPSLTTGAAKQFAAVAESRQIHWQAVMLASKMGCLRFGRVCGFECWILSDRSRQCAEARRIDGKPFPAIGGIAERKAHTLAGSNKSWPVGICPGEDIIGKRSGLLLTEGGPDFLASLHFLFLRRKEPNALFRNYHPVTMLGGSNRIDTEALRIMTGRNIRIFPHRDESGAGQAAALRWAEQLKRVGARRIELFDFADVVRRDGSTVGDLNDAVQQPNTETFYLDDILPSPPTRKN